MTDSVGHHGSIAGEREDGCGVVASFPASRSNRAGWTTAGYAGSRVSAIASMTGCAPAPGRPRRRVGAARSMAPERSVSGEGGPASWKREILDRPDVAVSEQFNQVLNAYQVENDYGRTLKAYTGKVQVNGEERVADILLVGRVALAYQTSDGGETGYWNKTQKEWQELDDSFQAGIRNDIRMARQQASLNLLPMPVSVED